MTKQFIFFLLLFINAAVFAQPTMRWQKNYGGSNNDSTTSIKQTSDGGYIVAGTTYSNDGDVTGNHGKADYWVAKLDAIGSIVWKKTYGGSGWDIATCVQQTSDGGYIVVGNSNSYNGDVTGRVLGAEGARYDAWIVKLDASGNISWNKCLYASINTMYAAVNAYASTVIQATDDSFIIGGMRVVNLADPTEVYDADTAPFYSWVVKLNVTGVTLWQSKQIVLEGGTTSSYIDSIGVKSIVQAGSTFTVLSSSGYHPLTPGACGIAQPIYNEGNVVVFNITSATGLYNWRMSYGGDFSGPPPYYIPSAAYDMQKTPDGGYIIAGTSGFITGCLAGAGNHGSHDFWIFKINSTGGLVWSKCFGGSNRDVATSIHIAADGNYYAGGYSYSSNGQVTDHNATTTTADYWIIKINSTGTLLWSKSYGGNGNDIASCMAKTTDGGYVVAGSSYSSYLTIVNKGSADWLLMKFDDCSIAAPAAPSQQNFLSCTKPKVSSLVATGTNIKWYSSQTSTTALSPTMLLPTGTYAYWLTQTTITGCESKRTKVTITVTFNPFCRTTGLRLQNDISPNGKAEPATFPNPNNGNFKINIPVDINVKNVSVQLTDIYGKIVLSKNCAVVNGYIWEIILAEAVASGMYFINIPGVEKNNSIKIMITK